MFTYICIPYRLQFVLLTKPACWYFSEILLSLNLFCAEQRRASVPQAKAELTCRSRLPVPAAGGLPFDKLSAGCRRMVSGLPHWGFSAPEAREELWPPLLHCLHEHMVQIAAAAEPTALCSEEGGAGRSLHLYILLHLGYLQHSNQATEQAEIYCVAANNSS